jgi:hypothetical protein
MVSVEKLKETTDEFFEKFCNNDLLNSRPTWSNNKWLFKGELPNNDKKGCYAHLINDEVIYIGLAIGNSYEGSGIGSRVSKYWKKSIDYSNTNQIYTPTIKDVTAIITLAFSEDNFYLAPALEVYLIQKLNPPKNRIHSKSK